MTESAGPTPPVAIPTSHKKSTSPGPHVHISPDSIADKPHRSSPPRPKSPLPPTASLTAAGADLLDRDAMALDRQRSPSLSGGERTGGTLHRQDQQSRSQNQSASGNTGSTSVIPSPPPEVEATLSKLTSHANVTGVLVLSRPEALVIRSGGAYFEPSGPGARDRAMRLKTVVEMVRNAVIGLERDIPKSEVGDELTFLRIRTKKYEMMISPSEKYLLVVLQDPTAAP